MMISRSLEGAIKAQKLKGENISIHDPCKSSPSFTILVSLRFIIISLVFFYLGKLLFLGFLQFKGNFVCGQNDSKCHVCAPLISLTV